MSNYFCDILYVKQYFYWFVSLWSQEIYVTCTFEYFPCSYPTNCPLKISADFLQAPNSPQFSGLCFEQFSLTEVFVNDNLTFGHGEYMKSQVPSLISKEPQQEGGFYAEFHAIPHWLLTTKPLTGIEPGLVLPMHFLQWHFIILLY